MQLGRHAGLVESEGVLDVFVAEAVGATDDHECRRQAREPNSAPIDDNEIASPEPNAPRMWETITDEQIAAALADLESPFREVYELRLFGNCSYDEIAERLTIPRSTVGTRLMRARQKLKKALVGRVAC